MIITLDKVRLIIIAFEVKVRLIIDTLENNKVAPYIRLHENLCVILLLPEFGGYIFGTMPLFIYVPVGSLIEIQSSTLLLLV